MTGIHPPSRLPHAFVLMLIIITAAVALTLAIPAGMQAAASLIFMILFIGGMFGVLRATGAVDAGIERLIARTSGNAYLLVPILIVGVPVFSGAGFRLITFVIWLGVGIPYLVRHIRRTGYRPSGAAAHDAAPLPHRHVAILGALAAAILVMLWGAQEAGWGNLEMGGF